VLSSLVLLLFGIGFPGDWVFQDLYIWLSPAFLKKSVFPVLPECDIFELPGKSLVLFRQCIPPILETFLT
jgi:hypothetical protein